MSNAREEGILQKDQNIKQLPIEDRPVVSPKGYDIEKVLTEKKCVEVIEEGVEIIQISPKKNSEDKAHNSAFITHKLSFEKVEDHPLSSRSRSDDNEEKLVKRLSSASIAVPGSLDDIQEIKNAEDQSSLWNKIQHGLFSFFEIMPNDTAKGIACNLTIWGIQTLASIWSGNTVYQGLYDWYNNHNEDNSDGINQFIQSLCLLAGGISFFLTQKGIGKGIQHYQLFRTVINNLQAAVEKTIHSISTFKKDFKELDSVKKQLELHQDLLKIVVSGVKKGYFEESAQRNINGLFSKIDQIKNPLTDVGLKKREQAASLRRSSSQMRL